METGYHAFISYSHRDSAFARKLHAKLESYRFPGRLVGSETPNGPLPRSLAPIFLDRHELADDGGIEMHGFGHRGINSPAGQGGLSGTLLRMNPNTKR